MLLRLPSSASTACCRLHCSSNPLAMASHYFGDLKVVNIYRNEILESHVFDIIFDIVHFL